MDNLHITAAKVVHMFQAEIREASRTGVLSMRVWMPLYLASVFWRGDTQEIEGVNNLLQTVVRRAPSIGLPLLDARVAIRKTACLGVRGASLKWTDVAPRVNAAIAEAIDHASEIDSVLNMPFRFSVPDPTLALCDTGGSRPTDPKGDPAALLWGQ
eukprot:1625901-Pyramimonas_sp.AAC.1